MPAAAAVAVLTAAVPTAVPAAWAAAVVAAAAIPMAARAVPAASEPSGATAASLSSPGPRAAAAGQVSAAPFSTSTGALTVTQSTFTANSAAGGAGGSGFGGGASDGGAGWGNGGAIFNDVNGQVTLSGCTFSGDQTSGGSGGSQGGFGEGGAIFNSSSAQVTLSACTLSGEQASGGTGTSGGNGEVGIGGAIFSSGTATLIDSTLTANSANGAGGTANGQGFDGAVHNLNGDLNLFNDTIVGNNAAFGSSDVRNLGLNSGNSSATVVNSIIGQYVDTSDSSSSSVSSGSNNLIESATVSGTPFSDDPAWPQANLLGPLQNNGGPTDTMELQAGPAINAGANLTGLFQALGFAAADQRGVARGLTWSIGAYQATPAQLEISGASAPTAGMPGSFTVTAVDLFGMTARGYSNTVALSAGARPACLPRH